VTWDLNVEQQNFDEMRRSSRGLFSGPNMSEFNGTVVEVKKNRFKLK
jgi:hypothetical protein